MFMNKLTSPIRFTTNRSSLRFLTMDTPKIYKFNDIKKLVENPKAGILLVDVREPNEMKEYTLPTSVNLPLKSSPGALSLNDDEFKQVFNHTKPHTTTELIFLCAKGRRAQTAEELARSFGYKKTGIYSGSINEWLELGGRNIKPVSTKETVQEKKEDN